MKREERAVARADLHSSSQAHRPLVRGARYLLLVLGLALAAHSALAMPPGWTKGCTRPLYGSAESACATSLQTPGSFFIVDTTLGSCRYFNANGSPAGQTAICPACPTGFVVDAQGNCSQRLDFFGPNPYANVGSDVQPALPAAQAARDPALVADPIHAQTGNNYQREVDFEGAGAFPLTFIRHYNSQFTYQSPLGLSWRHHYDRQLLRQDATHVVVVRPNGQAFEFILSGGAWIGSIDLTDKLQSTATGWQLTNQADEIESYDASGRLLSIANRSGLTQTLVYSTPATPASIAPKAGLLIAVSDASGHHLSFTYDLRSLVKTMTDGVGNVFQYTYNNQALLTTVTYPGSPAAVRTYVYKYSGINPFLANLLTGIRDENNQTFATFFYDEGTARTTGSSLGDALAADPYTLKYNTNNTSLVTDARTTRTYSFQIVRGLSRLTGVSQPCTGCGATFAARTYDANGFVASSTDFNGIVTSFQRTDAAGRLDLETSRTEGVGKPEARTITTEWDPAFRLPHRIAEPLRITTLSYDSQANLQTRSLQATSDANGAQGFSATTVGAARTWTYAYTYSSTVAGQISQMAIDGPRTDAVDTTVYDFDSTGNLFSVTNALGQVVTFSNYDANGRPQQIIDANGLATALTYDARGRILTRVVAGEHTAYAYDGVGQLLSVTHPDGSSLTYAYDAAHRLSQLQDNLGNRIVYTLDALGNRTKEQALDPNQTLARLRSREYNALNRLTKDIGGTPAALITQYGYDLQGNVTAVTDPLGHLTTKVYDALNRLTQATAPAAAGSGAGGITRYGYDGLDQLLRVTDARGLATTYTIDGLGNLTRLASPDTGVASRAVDAAGNLTMQIDTRGVTGVFVYDALNRITQATYTPPAGSAIAPLSITFSFDLAAFAAGRLSGITDPSGSIAYSYEGHGRLATDTRTIAGVPYTTTYSYDASGRQVGVTYPSGRTVDYTLDAIGRILQIDTSYNGVTQSLASGITYQPFGAVAGFTFGNAQTVSRQLDLDGRVTSYPIGAVIRNVIYDADSRITAFRHTNALLDQTFLYDNLERITGWGSVATTQSFGYDLTGNRTSLIVNATTYTSTYASTSNRLTSAAFPIPFNYQYDDAGNTTQDGLRSYSYDARSRLTQVVSSGVTTRFTVNALGQRVMKSPDAGLSRIFHYDQAGHLIAESRSSGEVLREYVYLNDLPIALISSDHDDDGVPDARDNCILDANPDQRDLSASGFGNICNGDVNGDGSVTQADLNLLVLLVHKPGGANTVAAKRADMNGDGVLNYQDEALLSQWIKQRGAPGPSGTRGQSAGPELFYIYADQLGTPRVLVDKFNKVRWQWTADPFGIQPPDQSPQGDFVSLPFNLRFPGQYYDRESGLHASGTRDYDPTTGRYLEPDPIGLRGGINLYTYAGSNPVSEAEPVSASPTLPSEWSFINRAAGTLHSERAR